jgi:LysM repeat protein
MSYGSPARWVAPLALLAALVAVFAIVTSTMGDGDSSPSAPAGTQERRAEGSNRDGNARTGTSTTRTGTTDAGEPPQETYVVRSGDTLASIAEETDTTVAELQELNPGVDSNSLTIGQEIRLAR